MHTRHSSIAPPLLLSLLLSLLTASVSAGELQGCFRDSGDDFGVNGHDLDGSRFSDAAMTVSACVQRCTAEGFKFAGVQMGSQCFCGNSHGSQGRLADDQCNERCAGNPGELCGGYMANRVFSTNIAQTQASTASSQPAASTPANQSPPQQAAPQGQSGVGNFLGQLVQSGIQVYQAEKEREAREEQLALERERLQIQNPTPQNAAVSSGPDGYSVNFVSYGQGQFEKRGAQWVESSGGQDRFFFTELRRDQTSVYLYDASRGVDLKLNVAERQIFYSDVNQPTPSPLYQIMEVR